MARIVVAGQDTVCIESVCLAIESLGHNAILVEFAEDVVNEVLELDAALAVLDESMATFNGYEVAEMLRAEPGIADSFSILLLVASVADRRNLDKAGVSEYFVKGRETAELGDLLVKCLGDEAGIGVN